MAANESPLVFHDIAFHADGDEVAVWRPEAGLCGVFPPDGAQLLRHLMAGNSPAAAATWYRAAYGEAVDMDGFLAVLDELGLLRTRYPRGWRWWRRWWRRARAPRPLALASV